MNDQSPVITKERIPYHPGIQERYGIDRGSWRALIDAVFPTATTIEGVLLALSYCKQRRLDVFKRPVHVVPIWNKQQNRLVETVWPGIGELRTTAFRTGHYRGCDEAVFGPDVTKTFTGDKGNATVTFPEWCQITVHRVVYTADSKWVGPRVYWLETYARIGRSEIPNDMWQRRPRGQLEKCAEAAALRRAFPEEIGEDHIPEEAGEMRDITPAVPQPEAQRQPAAAPTYHALYSADGEEFQLQDGEIEQWARDQFGRLPDPDALDALIKNNPEYAERLERWLSEWAHKSQPEPRQAPTKPAKAAKAAPERRQGASPGVTTSDLPCAAATPEDADDPLGDLDEGWPPEGENAADSAKVERAFQFQDWSGKNGAFKEAVELTAKAWQARYDASQEHPDAAVRARTRNYNRNVQKAIEDYLAGDADSDA